MENSTNSACSLQSCTDAAGNIGLQKTELLQPRSWLGKGQLLFPFPLPLVSKLLSETRCWAPVLIEYDHSYLPNFYKKNMNSKEPLPAKQKQDPKSFLPPIPCLRLISVQKKNDNNKKGD